MPIFCRFARVPKFYWNDKSNQLKFLKELEENLGVKQPEDWYNIKYQDVQNNEGWLLLNHYNGSMSRMLRSLYPDFEWDFTR